MADWGKESSEQVEAGTPPEQPAAPDGPSTPDDKVAAPAEATDGEAAGAAKDDAPAADSKPAPKPGESGMLFLPRKGDSDEPGAPTIPTEAAVTPPPAPAPRVHDRTVKLPSPAPKGGNGTSAAEVAASSKETSRTTVILPAPDSPFAPAPDSMQEASDLNRPDVPPPSGVFRLTRIMERVPPKAPPEPLLQVEGLRKKLGGREIVKGVDLSIGAGEIVGLLGRNGAGKTTTFRMIMGMLQPDKGKVMFDFRDITRLPMYRRANRGIGYLAQEPSVFEKMTVEDNLIAVLELQEPDRKIREQRLEELIKKLGLETVRKSMASSPPLSGGERRRLEIARAMTLKPRVVLFDEPFASIDPIAITEIQGIVRNLKREGIGGLLTDHNVRETLKITDRTYIMDEGKIWIHGSPHEIVNHPEAKKRYLGDEFRFDF